MTYDEFQTVLSLPQFNTNEHAALVVYNQILPEEEFMPFFTQHIKNLRLCFHTHVGSNIYIVVNKDMEIDGLSDYELVTPLNKMPDDTEEPA